jgi:hypothetical protein
MNKIVFFLTWIAYSNVYQFHGGFMPVATYNRY